MSSDPTRIHAAHLAGQRQQAPFTPMHGVYEVLTAIVQGCFLQPLYHGQKAGIQTQLRSAIGQTRGYVVQDAADLHPIWVAIRTHVPTTDFLIDVTTQLHMSLAGSALPYEALTNNMAAAMGSHRMSDQHAMVDPDLLRRMPDTKAAREILLANPWFVTLLLLSHRPQLLAE